MEEKIGVAAAAAVAAAGVVHKSARTSCDAIQADYNRGVTITRSEENTSDSSH